MIAGPFEMYIAYEAISITIMAEGSDAVKRDSKCQLSRTRPYLFNL